MTSPTPVIFSDLDGTLLDHDTYSFDAARPALELIRRRGVPLVLCSSKTRAEIEALRDQLVNRDPFIVENGGAVCVPDGYFPFAIHGAERRGSMLVIPIGAPYATLVKALARASERSGVAVRGFADMSAHEIAAATALSPDAARLAHQREFDEPFEIVDPVGGGEDTLLAAIEREGFRWTAGGRFYHIMGGSDKGAAVRLLTTLFHRHFDAVTTIGLGDAPNDASMLLEVDVPVLIRSPRVDRLHALVPRARRTRSEGPRGWNEAVLEILR